MKSLAFPSWLVPSVLDGSVQLARRTTGLEYVNSYPGRLEGDGSMGPLGYRGLAPSDYYIRSKRAYHRNPGAFHWFVGEREGEINPIPVRCPWTVGDLLYMREGWHVRGLCWSMPIRASKAASRDAFIYRANDPDDWSGGWRSASHMPEWASRLVLRVESVRAERLQTITRIDAIREGARSWISKYDSQMWSLDPSVVGKEGHGLGTPQYAFANAWNVIHAGPRWNLKDGPSPWDVNPWIWRLEFAIAERRGVAITAISVPP